MLSLLGMCVCLTGCVKEPERQHTSYETLTLHRETVTAPLTWSAAILRPTLERMLGLVTNLMEQTLQNNNIEVTTVKARIKTRKSLAGKLVLKGSKYADVTDITDLLGARVITYYTDDVDRIASIVEQCAQSRRIHHRYR